MTPLDFSYIRTLVKERAAIVLEPEKQYLVEARLLPLSRREGFGSISELVVALQARFYGDLHKKVVEAMTVNETSFFRDHHPFEALKLSILPKLIEARRRERELWILSAASSSGQEAYSVAMMISEHFPQLRDWNLTILGVDISNEMVEYARRGIYNQIEIGRGLPPGYQQRYFNKVADGWEANETLRRMVRFSQMNLAQSWCGMPPLDIVFLRNVMIYFDIETKKKILGQVRETIQPDGYLILGGTETTLGLDPGFSQVRLHNSTLYQLAPQLQDTLAHRAVVAL